MAKVSFKLRDIKSDDNLKSVILVVSNGSSNKIRIATSIKINSKYWIKETEQLEIKTGLRKAEAIKENDSRKVDNEILLKTKQRALTVIHELEKVNKSWTNNQFKEAFHNKPKQFNISEYFKRHIQNLRETNHVGNANCYDSTLNILNLFDAKFEKKVFAEIDYKYVCNLNTWLEKRGCKGNTRKYYFKALRALMNKAIKDKECTRETYPFGNDGFQIAKLTESTEKRYLPTEYLEKIKTKQSDKRTTEFARLLFLFSYYAYGMSYVDMAMLTKGNIKTLEGGKYIVYIRQKVKNNKEARPIKIKLKQNLIEVIEQLTKIQQPLGNYLLPIVSRDKRTEQELYEHIVTRRKRYGKALKELATEFKFDVNLTSYVSRHTMAMQLQNNNIPEAVTSQILNHSDLKTTKTYLADLKNDVIDNATDVL